MNFNNLNSERIMKTKTITDHELSKIAEDWYNKNEYVNTDLKTAFVAGYKYAENQANGHDTGERQLPIPDVSVSLPVEEIKNAIYQFKKEELSDAESPFHYEAEIWAGMKHFIQWLEANEQ